MKDGEFHRCFASSRRAALALLSFLELLITPAKCREHDCALVYSDISDGHSFWWCRESVAWRSKKGKICSGPCGVQKGKFRWYEGCPLAQSLPKMHPEQLVELLWSFSRERDPEEVGYNLGIHHSTVGFCYHEIRCMLLEYMSLGASENKLGADGRIVVMDVTFRSKIKRQSAGFVGAPSLGQKTAIVGLVELDGAGLERKTTGRVVLALVADENGPSMKAALEKYVHPGSEIWTDGGGAFAFLEGQGYKHENVVHRQKEFSKIKIVADEAKLISTNAAEGLFGLVKQWLRRRHATALRKESYGPWLAEFLWRQANCGSAALGVERESARVEFWELVHALGVVRTPYVHWGMADATFKGEWDFTESDSQTRDDFALTKGRDLVPVLKRSWTRRKGEQPAEFGLGLDWKEAEKEFGKEVVDDSVEVDFELREAPQRDWVTLGELTPEKEASGSEEDDPVARLGFPWHVEALAFSGDEAEAGGSTPEAVPEPAPSLEEPPQDAGEEGSPAVLPEPAKRVPKARRKRTVPLVEVLGVPNKRKRRPRARQSAAGAAEAVAEPAPEVSEEGREPPAQQRRRSARVAERKAVDLD